MLELEKNYEMEEEKAYNSQ